MIFAINHNRPNAWTQDEINFVREQHGKMTVSQIAVAISRSDSAIYKMLHDMGLCKKRREHPGLDEFIRTHHAMGLVDAEIVAKWNAENPSDQLSRKWLCDIRGGRLKLASNARKDR